GQEAQGTTAGRNRAGPGSPGATAGNRRPFAPTSVACPAPGVQGQLAMTRIFLTLASANALALVLAFALGCWSKLTDGLHAPASPAYLLHFLVGLSTAVGPLLTHCLIFPSSPAPGGWVKEVTRAYDLRDEPWHKRTRELKRLTFPPALAAMLV